MKEKEEIFYLANSLDQGYFHYYIDCDKSKYLKFLWSHLLKFNICFLLVAQISHSNCVVLGTSIHNVREGKQLRGLALSEFTIFIIFRIVKKIIKIRIFD